MTEPIVAEHVETDALSRTLAARFGLKDAPVVVEITHEDIVFGVRGSCHWCPIARAVSRAFGGLALVEVSPSRIYVGNRRWDTPDEARRFMTLFDSTGIGEPFSFELAS